MKSAVPPALSIVVSVSPSQYNESVSSRVPVIFAPELVVANLSELSYHKSTAPSLIPRITLSPADVCTKKLPLLIIFKSCPAGDAEI